MGINTSWQTSLAFRRFRKKLNELSRVYWTHQMGADTILNHSSTANPNDFIVDSLGCSFDKKMHPKTVSETIDWIPKYLERTRLHILILTSASLEAYLKDITFNFIASQGYLKIPNSNSELLKLNELGEALGSPILNKSSIPEPLKFAEKLFDVDYGNRKTIWNKSYKLRCVAAHNGGMVMPKTLTQIPDLSIPEFEMIGLSWEELRKSMNAADEIVALTDNKIASYDITAIEAEQMLRILKKKGRLPLKKNIWSFMHDEFSIKVNRNDKLRLESLIF